MQNITGMVERVGKNIKLSLRSYTAQLDHLAGSDRHVQKIYLKMILSQGLACENLSMGHTHVLVDLFFAKQRSCITQLIDVLS